MEKICVFCGERPVSKTSEHVLPRWLIELTGGPKRQAIFSYKDFKEGHFGNKEHSFDAFKFPACNTCNQEYAEFEAKICNVVKKITSEEALSGIELNDLLDWFDKVRIGLWLGFRYLDKNWLDVNPKFFIKSRIRQHDRILVIFKADVNRQGLNFAGCDTPSFAFTPSCFTLRINNFSFLNMSYPYLFSRRIGFPYPIETFTTEEDNKLMCQLAKSRDYIMMPVLKKHIRLKGTELYQPIFAGNLDSEGNQEISSMYDTQYVRNNCITWEEGIGRIFINRGLKLKVYPEEPTTLWIPERQYNFESLAFEIQLMSLEWQLYIDKLAPSLKLVSKQFKRSVATNMKINRDWNHKMMQTVREKAKNMGIPALR